MCSIYGVLALFAIFAATFGCDDFHDSFDSIELDKHLEKSEIGNSPRIIGGTNAVATQIPYQVGLRINYSLSASWCGGCLISDTFVLTAAHCAQRPKFIDCYLGAIEIRNLNEEGRVNVRVPAENIFVHKAYNSGRISNDIALLKFPKPVAFTDRIKAIALPGYSQVSVDFANSEVISSGWGRTNDILGSTISDTLRFSKVRVQSEALCKYFFGSLILSSNICTETTYGQGICNGDSGGPVAITRSDGTPMLLGLSSFVSSRGCVKCWPSVYVRVSYYLDWIAQHSDIPIPS